MNTDRYSFMSPNVRLIFTKLLSLDSSKLQYEGKSSETTDVIRAWSIAVFNNYNSKRMIQTLTNVVVFCCDNEPKIWTRHIFQALIILKWNEIENNYYLNNEIPDNIKYMGQECFIQEEEWVFNYTQRLTTLTKYQATTSADRMLLNVRYVKNALLRNQN